MVRHTCFISPFNAGRPIEVDSETGAHWKRVMEEYEQVQDEMRKAYRESKAERITTFNNFVSNWPDETPESFDLWWKESEAAKTYRRNNRVPTVESFKDAMKLNWGDYFGNLVGLANRIDDNKQLFDKEVLSKEELRGIEDLFNGVSAKCISDEKEAALGRAN